MYSCWVRNDNLFCCHECMIGNVESDQKGYFNCIKNSLYKFVFLYHSVSYTCFQVSVSIMSELIDTISFTIFESCMDIQNW